ncbi:hypothetical protein WY02_27045 [Pseudonocardia sp. AL041005-10]|nr:hypothetical protein WY02_27045 [Pseudonocardia sp. AL041005-10]
MGGDPATRTGTPCTSASSGPRPTSPRQAHAEATARTATSAVADHGAVCGHSPSEASSAMCPA